MTAQEITTLKKDGVDQGSLIDKIIQGSATFHTKTVFAQEKYIKKKKLKHKQNLCVLEVTLAHIVDSNFKKEPKRIGNLRVDSLARMMTFGNVHSKSRVMLYESCMGLVAAAIMDRLSEDGTLYKGFPEGKSKNSDNHLVNLLNYPKSHNSICEHFEMKQDISEDPIFDNFGGVDSLVLAGGEFDPVAVFAKLYDFLLPGGNFVVYSIYQEPLMDLYRRLKGNVVLLQLSESWMREYQVLPHRTHPMMRTSSTSGYLLSGLKTTNKFKIL
jgi:tRNA (adenine-N(1)-)-methyltransferase non-catalytic subunit